MLQEREFIRLNESVYKLGKSKQENTKRIQSYPKGSLLILMLQFDNCDKAESDLLKILKRKFTQKLEYGSEYFEGNVALIKHEIITYYSQIDSVNTIVGSDETMEENVTTISNKTTEENVTAISNKTTEDNVTILHDNGTMDENKSSPYFCNKCMSQTKNKFDFKKHCDTGKHNLVKPNDSNTTVSCRQCKKTFTTASGLWKHKRKCKTVQQAKNDPNPFADIMQTIIKQDKERERKREEREREREKREREREKRENELDQRRQAIYEQCMKMLYEGIKK